MGFADEQFYVEQIATVERLPKWVVAQVAKDRTWCHETPSAR
ncbi:hypothetical protein V475_23060 [Sphingobium baderi LL03]|uniref:Uncharacterized protein n=2 Tax=Sphingobium baderi TaxID=1332080 RepID=T0H0T8_9SPHN|nr:hypothetical protein L485_02070 [Sphingobium baderi LL03]KMS50637.1 hypothetical protein V475_23060 [Sphingobium baderi LL03]